MTIKPKIKNPIHIAGKRPFWFFSGQGKEQGRAVLGVF
jgi:hypothetical protein